MLPADLVLPMQGVVNGVYGPINQRKWVWLGG